MPDNIWPTNENEKKYDVLGTGDHEGGPGTGLWSDNYNINDLAYGLKSEPTPRGMPETTKFWETDKLSLGDLPPLTIPEKTCSDKCEESITLQRKKCDVLRKRVAEALKHAGCPSKVTGFPRKSRCPKRDDDKKKSAKKSATAKARRRR